MIKLANKQLDKLAAFFERVEASFDDGFPTERAEILTFIFVTGCRQFPHGIYATPAGNNLKET